MLSEKSLTVNGFAHRIYFEDQQTLNSNLLSGNKTVPAGACHSLDINVLQIKIMAYPSRIIIFSVE